MVVGGVKATQQTRALTHRGGEAVGQCCIPSGGDARLCELVGYGVTGIEGSCSRQPKGRKLCHQPVLVLSCVNPQLLSFWL